MTTSTWQILVDPATAPLVGAPLDRAESESVFQNGVSARGVIRPFRRGGSDLANVSGVELVSSNIGQILGTACSDEGGESRGELPWRTEFGSLAFLLRLRNNSAALAEQGRAFVARALARWEPRCRVRKVTVDRPGREQNKLVLRILWDLVSAGDGRLIVPGIETSVAVG